MMYVKTRSGENQQDKLFFALIQLIGSARPKFDI